jgi:hypothetical protein
LEYRFRTPYQEELVPGGFLTYTVICSAVRGYQVMEDFRSGNGTRQEGVFDE